MRKFSKTTILTLWMDVMTMTMVKKMGNNFKCWRILGKLVSFVMVNVHWRTATIQPEQDFNHPPPPSPMAKIHLDAHFPPRGFPKPDRHIVFNPKRSYIKILKRGYFIGISFTYMLNSGNFIKVNVCVFDIQIWPNQPLVQVWSGCFECLRTETTAKSCTRKPDRNIRKSRFVISGAGVWQETIQNWKQLLFLS